MLQSIEHDRGVLKEKQLKFANVYDSPQADEIRAHLKTVIESLQQKIQSKKLKVQELQSEIREIRRCLEDEKEACRPENGEKQPQRNKGTEKKKTW
jgi:hypothetical protein